MGLADWSPRQARNSGVGPTSAGKPLTVHKAVPSSLNTRPAETAEILLVRDPSIPTTDADGRVVILDMTQGAYVSFNPVAGEIWHMLSEPCRVGDLLAVLSARHDVDDETLSRDVMPFLQTLVDQKLVRLIDAAERG